MLSTGPNYSKLKTNLRLAISRLKLIEKKKTELAQKARREIADYIANDKLERAKIRVEHIIREDYLVEAMELVEMYCDLLLARFGLIQQMKTLDEGLTEAISSLIWATPRLQADINELKIISEQLTSKYGKPYAQAVRDETIDSVNDKLKHKLSIQSPPKLLVEKYLIEISKSHNVVYTPDPDVMRQANEENQTLIDLGGPNAGTTVVSPFVIPNQVDVPSESIDNRPPLPAHPPSGPFQDIGAPPIGFTIPDIHHFPQDMGQGHLPEKDLLPSIKPPTAPPRASLFKPADTFPDLPSVPQSSFPIQGPGVQDGASTSNAPTGGPVDFDDLTRRFEELKKRK